MNRPGAVMPKRAAASLPGVGKRLALTMRSSGMVFLLLLLGLLLLGWHMWRTGRAEHLVGGLSTIKMLQESQRGVQRPEGSEYLARQVQAMAQPPPAPSAATTLTYGASNLRDPFVGPLHIRLWQEAQQQAMAPRQEIAPSLPPPQLMVQGVILGGDHPYAIVNNETVRPGDEIQGARVLRIDSGGIVIRFGGQELRYPTGQGSGVTHDAPGPWQSTPPSVNRPYF